MIHLIQEASENRRRNPFSLIGLICSSCGLGFTSEKELRDHQVICRSSCDFLSQFRAHEKQSSEELN
jgi:hypothetical protein